MKKKILSVMMALAMTASLAACGSSDAGSEASGDAATGDASTTEESAASGELTEVSLGTVAWPTNMMFYLADEQGIFEKNGLKVTIQEFSSTTDSSSAFIGGQTDFCTYASSETISPFSQGAEFSIVLETDKSNGCEGLVATSDIKTVEDLKGKTIATQLYSVDHMFLLTLLDEHGMTEADVNIVDMSIQEAGNAFVAGQCDAACIWDPYFSQAKEAGGTVLYSTADNPDLITDVLAASKSLCEENPDAVTAMVKSYFEAVEYYEANKDEAAAFMAEKLGVDAEEFNNEMAGLLVPDATEAVEAFTEADDYSYWGYTQNTVREFMTELGVLETDVECGDMIDASFVQSIADAE